MESLPVSKGRVLCTEDDLDTREMLTLLLQEAGYEVECTESSEHTIALVKEQFFDLIMVDNWMPRMGGNEVTREIRKFNRSTPILFYSGAAYESDKQAARDSGASGYLTKPEGVFYLVDEVARLITEARIAFPVAIDRSQVSH